MEMYRKHKLIVSMREESRWIINGETCIGVWDEDLEFVFKQAIDNLNLENEFHIIKPAYYTDGKKADGKIALTVKNTVNCIRFWDEVRNVCRQNKKQYVGLKFLI